jgi:GTP cyclohydrolase IB
MGQTKKQGLIADTQSESDHRHLEIDQVGVKKIRYPLQLLVADQVQATVGLWSLAVGLPAIQKGTHMSRLIGWLDGLKGPIDSSLLSEKFKQMLTLLGASQGQVAVTFPFFLRKRAPVSLVESNLDYEAGWTIKGTQARVEIWAFIQVAVKSLCPCSKEISSYGAHNQRSHVRLNVELLNPVPWPELVRFAEDSASSEIWPLLKRADEKWITEHAYENPKFVEDLVRDVALRLNADRRVGRYEIEVENFESIHNHSAYARIERL